MSIIHLLSLKLYKKLMVAEEPRDYRKCAVVFLLPIISQKARAI